MQHFARSAETAALDIFFVTAALTVLALRVYLAAANYPQLGGGGLHIAHALWGGLGMVVAIVILLAFLSSPVTKRIAALVGGFGFGAFVDELGKFTTSDNNYFFKPTAALIYTVFVVLYLVAREIRSFRKLTPTENLANAIEISKQLALGQLSVPSRHRALALLRAADQDNQLVSVLREEFLAARTWESRPSRLAAIARAGHRRYVVLVGNKWFRRVIAAIFVLQAVGVVLGSLALIAVTVAVLVDYLTLQQAMTNSGIGDFSSAVATIASLIGGVFTVVGVIRLRRSRLRAYVAFERAILVDLLLAQPFTLVDAGFAGILGVIVDLILLVTLRYMISQERRLLAHETVERPPDTNREPTLPTPQIRQA